MSEIYLDRTGMELRLNTVVDRIDEVDAALGKMPAVPDGGIASSMMAFIASAGAEAAGLAANTARLLSAVAMDVLEDMSATDTRIAQELREMEKDLEAS